MNQKKFKHIPTGNIAVETSSEKNYKVSEPKNFTIPKWIIEDSGDWEEVEEQEFEILEFIRDNIPTTFSKPFDLKFLPLYMDEGYKISKIRRLFDNEVFTLGDKVTYNYKANYAPWIIDNFFIRTDGKILVRSANNSICEVISEIKKYKEPLLVTDDNVEIFEGDEYWHIYYTTLHRGHWKLIKEKCPKFPFSVMTHTLATFKSEELAKKYLDENKPLYSKKQIREAVESSFVRENYILNVPHCCADKFKEEIFKQKLGL